MRSDRIKDELGFALEFISGRLHSKINWVRPARDSCAMCWFRVGHRRFLPGFANLLAHPQKLVIGVLGENDRHNSLNLFSLAWRKVLSAIALSLLKLT